MPPEPAMSPHIAIYGAVADTPPQLASRLPWLAGLKRYIKAQRDIRRLGKTPDFQCDYRDYGVAQATNIGDIAIAETIRRTLRRRIPGCSFVNIDWGDHQRLQNRHAQRAFDLLVVAGGGYFLFNHAGTLPPRLQDDLAFLKASQVPYILWGVGVNQPFNPQGGVCKPAPSATDMATMQDLLDNAELITVRDQYSADYLATCTARPVHLIGDPVLHAAQALALPQDRPDAHDAPLIGLNFPFHGPSSNRFLLANLAAYARALQGIQRATGCRFRYITHHACEYVVPRLLRASGIPLEIVHADLDGTCRAYRDLDLHIGGMLHSCILSASAGTPWIAIAYDIKHKGFNQLMGMDKYYQDTLHFSETELVSLALQALEEKEALREHIAARREQLDRHSAGIIAAALARYPT